MGKLTLLSPFPFTWASTVFVSPQEQKPKSPVVPKFPVSAVSVVATNSTYITSRSEFVGLGSVSSLLNIPISLSILTTSSLNLDLTLSLLVLRFLVHQRKVLDRLLVVSVYGSPYDSFAEDDSFVASLSESEPLLLEDSGVGTIAERLSVDCAGFFGPWIFVLSGPLIALPQIPFLDNTMG